jgi:hypothetical protein
MMCNQTGHLAIQVTNSAARAAGNPVVGNVKPVSPIGGAGIATLLGYAMWGAIIACAVVALVSGGILAVGQLSNNPGHSDKGKRALLYALGGVAIAALGIPLVNTVFGNVHATS